MAVIQATKKKMLDDLLSLGTLKAMLLTDSHVTDATTQNFISDVSTNEISSAGYTTGGEQLTAITTNVVTENVVLDFDTISLTGITATIQYLALFVDTGTASTSPIILIEPLGVQTLNGDNFNYDTNANGILNF